MCPMRAAWIVPVVALLAVSGCAAQAVPEPTPTGPATVTVGGHQVDIGLAAKIDAFFAADNAGAFRNRRAVLVTVAGQTVYERRTGPATPSSTYNVQSVGKSIMGTLVGVAVAEGRLKLDQTLADLLPSYQADMSPYIAKVTLKQLLTMSGGLPNDFYPDVVGPQAPEGADWVATVLRAGQEKLPGRFAYSNGDSHLLAAVLTEATGQSVLDYARARLFGPLGIPTEPAAQPVLRPAEFAAYDAAGFAWPSDPQGIQTGAGGQKLTASDLARLGRLWLDRGKWEGRQLVPANWMQAATTQQVAAVDGRGYGYQFWTLSAGGHPAFAAMGAGGQLVEVVPELDLVVVVQSISSTDPTAAPETGIADEDRWSEIVTELVVPAIRP